MDIYFALQSDTDGSPLTGEAANVTVYISKDGGAFAATTNAAAEVGRGLYKVTLTSAESEFTTLYYQPVCTGAQTNTYAIDAPVTMPTVPTAQDNASAVWGAAQKIVTIDSTQAATLATASALSTVGDNVTAVKAKTDNLPANPAAVGDAMTLTAAYDAAKTASQFDVSTDAVNLSINSVNAVQSGLSTFNPATDSVTINSTQAATFASASSITPILALLETLYSGLFYWEVQNNELTIYDSDGLAISAYTLTKDATGNIIAVTPEDGE